MVGPQFTLYGVCWDPVGLFAQLQFTRAVPMALRCLEGCGNRAWMNCRQLQIVHLPDTVVSQLHGLLAGAKCPWLPEVWLHFGHYLFLGCINLFSTSTDAMWA